MRLNLHFIYIFCYSKLQDQFPYYFGHCKLLSVTFASLFYNTTFQVYFYTYIFYPQVDILLQGVLLGWVIDSCMWLIISSWWGGECQRLNLGPLNNALKTRLSPPPLDVILRQLECASPQLDYAAPYLTTPNPFAYESSQLDIRLTSSLEISMSKVDSALLPLDYASPTICRQCLTPSLGCASPLNQTTPRPITRLRLTWNKHCLTPTGLCPILTREHLDHPI